MKDSKRYINGSSFFSVLRLFLVHPGFRYVYLYRLCNRYKRTNLIGISARVYYKIIGRRYGMQIPHKTIIGEGLFIGHWGNIIINQNAVIGCNCNIAQGVTIGYVSRGKRKGCPKIGNRVWIGANSVIVGNITIGDDVLIAPLTLVNFDVPCKAVVAGNPASIISYNSSAGYIKNLV